MMETGPSPPLEQLVVHNLDLSFGHKQSLAMADNGHPPVPTIPPSSAISSSIQQLKATGEDIPVNNSDHQNCVNMQQPTPQQVVVNKPVEAVINQSAKPQDKRKAKTPRKCSTPPNKKPPKDGATKRRRRTASGLDTDKLIFLTLYLLKLSNRPKTPPGVALFGWIYLDLIFPKEKVT